MSGLAVQTHPKFAHKQILCGIGISSLQEHYKSVLPLWPKERGHGHSKTKPQIARQADVRV